MKKVLVTLIALSLPTFALADATKGFYVQADAGHSTISLKDKDDGETFTIKNKGFTPRLSAGYDFGDFRVAADYTHYKTFKGIDEVGDDELVHYKAKFKSVGVSAIYDFNINAPVKPYVGARLGINHISVNREDETSSENETKMGIGALAGVSYEVTPNIALDAGYRYNYWGKFDGLKTQSHEVSAGVRVKF